MKLRVHRDRNRHATEGLGNFYIWNIRHWLQEAMDNCNTRGLDPEAAVFIMVLFSSLDDEFVEFFQGKQAQVSQYSGENLHIITPVIYNDSTTPDSELRWLRYELQQRGINLDNEPSAIFFKLTKRMEGSGFEPEFFAAFNLPEFPQFKKCIKNIIDDSIKFRDELLTLQKRLGLLLKAQNLVGITQRSPEGLISRFETDSILHAPRVFISYSHKDRPVVDEINDKLKANNIKAWIDIAEIAVGSNIRSIIDEAIRSSDVVISVLSEASSMSRWVQCEGAFFSGSGANRTIIPVVVDETGRRMARELPFTKDRLLVDYTDVADKEASIDRIIRSIEGWP